MAAPILLRTCQTCRSSISLKDVLMLSCARKCLGMSEQMTSYSHFHSSSRQQKDRRKDKAVAQYLYYVNHEKTMKHRNLELHNLPDYSYTDGRPTEVAISQKIRQKKNYELAKHVVQLVEEMQLAEKVHLQQEKERENYKKDRVDRQLKTKQTEFTG